MHIVVHFANDTGICEAGSLGDNAPEEAAGSTTCIAITQDKDDSSLVRVRVESLDFISDILQRLHIATAEYASTNSKPLCGAEMLVLEGFNTSLTRLKKIEPCYSYLVEQDLLVEFSNYNTDLNQNVFSVSEFATVTKERYLFTWNGSGYQRRITQTVCFSCQKAPNIYSNGTHLLITHLDGAQDQLPIIQPQNGSNFVCEQASPRGNPLHARVPKIIIFVLIIISLISLVLTFITYIIFPELRNHPGKIVLNFLSSLFLAMFCVLIDISLSKETTCVFLAPFSHYFWLSTFIWMNILCVNTALTLTRPTQTFKHTGNKSLFIYIGYGWGSPALIVLTSLLLHFCECTDIKFKYGVVKEGGEFESCWIGGDYVADILLYTVIVSILLGVNFVMFIYTYYVVRKVTREIQTRQDKNNNMHNKASVQNCLFIKVSNVKCHQDIHTHTIGTSNVKISL